MPPRPEKQVIQFRDDGYILVNMSRDVASAPASGVFFGILSTLALIWSSISELGSILERGDLALAQQSQDISEFITRCSQFARKKLGLQVERQEPPNLAVGSGHTQPVVSLLPKSHGATSVVSSLSPSRVSFASLTGPSKASPNEVMGLCKDHLSTRLSDRWLRAIRIPPVLCKGRQNVSCHSSFLYAECGRCRLRRYAAGHSNGIISVD